MGRGGTGTGAVLGWGWGVVRHGLVGGRNQERENDWGAVVHAVTRQRGGISKAAL